MQGSRATTRHGVTRRSMRNLSKALEILSATAEVAPDLQKPNQFCHVRSTVNPERPETILEIRHNATFLKVIKRSLFKSLKFLKDFTNHRK